MRYTIYWHFAARGISEFLRWIDICGQGFEVPPTEFDYRETGDDKYGIVCRAKFVSPVVEVPLEMIHNLEVFLSTLTVPVESWMCCEQFLGASAESRPTMQVYLYRADDKPIMAMNNRSETMKEYERRVAEYKAKFQQQ